MKTIRMPKKMLADWLAALRSGKYRQGVGTLQSNDGTAHCCLGVLQMAVDGKVERHQSGRATKPLPSLLWLEAKGITFSTGPGENTLNPFLPSLGMSAVGANDTNCTFAEIANAIEACAEGY